jgi:hypothetical protein
VCGKLLHALFQTYPQVIITWYKTGMSNMRPFASTPAARTKDTVIWSCNGQNCSFYNLNWMNVRRSQKTGCFSLFRMFFYTWKYDSTISKCKIHSEQRKHTVCQACPVWPSWQHKCDPYGARGTLGLTCLVQDKENEQATKVFIIFWSPEMLHETGA